MASSTRSPLFPAGLCPAGPFPAGPFPAGLFPAGLCPAGPFPAGLFPAGLFPAGPFPAGLCPAVGREKRVTPTINRILQHNTTDAHTPTACTRRPTGRPAAHTLCGA